VHYARKIPESVLCGYRKHDLAIFKEKADDFAERLGGDVVIADKGYVSKDFAEEMEVRVVKFVVVKRENIIKSEEDDIKN